MALAEDAALGFLGAPMTKPGDQSALTAFFKVQQVD
jgi:hypothetical protein